MAGWSRRQRMRPSQGLESEDHPVPEHPGTLKSAWCGPCLCERGLASRQAEAGSALGCVTSGRGVTPVSLLPSEPGGAPPLGVTERGERSCEALGTVPGTQ